MIFESIKKYVSTGDRMSANNIYNYCIPIVRNISYKFCKNRHDVEDSIILVMSRIFSVLHTYNNFNSDNSLTSWIKKVTYNVLITDYNSKKNKKIETVEYSDIIRNQMRSTDYPAISREDVEPYMRNLSLNEREAFDLYYFKGKSNKEISDLLGISVNASKVRLHRSVEKIKKNLQ